MIIFSLLYMYMYMYSVLYMYMYIHLLCCVSLMQITGDLEALEAALTAGQGSEPKVVGAGKCSALVNVLPDNAELFVSHDTWGDYQSMLRVYKLYDLNYSTSANGQ